MKVIGAGWGRTGTTSVAAALVRLGFGPVLHMQEMWAHPELAELWPDAPVLLTVRDPQSWCDSVLGSIHS